MKNILIPYDFSELSDYALQLGIEIAEKLEANILILNVIHTGKSTVFNNDGSLSESNRFDIDVVQEQSEKNDRLLSAIGKNKDFLSHKVSIGDIEEHILDISEKMEMDLIIMGTHGSSGISEYISGSITDKIIRKTDAAVISLKCERELSDFKKIVLVADFEHPYKENVSQLLELKEAIGAELHFLRVNTPNSKANDEQTKKNMSTYAAENNIDVKGFHTIESSQLEQGIEKFMKEQEIYVAAIASKGRLGLNAFFKGCLSADLVNHLQQPVFTFKAIR